MTQVKKEIQEITKDIIQKYKPEKIILFGSFAWGRPNRNSDVDLLIIKKTKAKFFRRVFALRKIIDGRIPVDILVKTPEEIQKRLNLGDFFYQDIIKKGKSLYEKSRRS